jgi:hypothetical protein
MLATLLDILFGCSHTRTTFPLTPSRRVPLPASGRRGTYIVCLECGREFDYSWKEMRVGGESAETAHAAIPAELEKRA